MNTRRPARVVVALTLGSLLVAACSSTASTNGPTSSASDDQSLAKVKDAEELVVGTEGTYRPFSYHENGSGDLTGYDVEVIRAVAEKLGVDVRFEETQWDAIFAGLEAGRFDVIANQVSITPEREAAYTFSAPYTYSPGVIVVRADDGSITSFESLAGKTTAQSLTSNWYALAEENGASIEAVEGWAQAIALVEQSRVDATINDKLTFLDYKTQTGAAGLKVAAQTDEVSRSAFALRSGAVALADAIDGALAELAADGTLAKISTEFFGEDVSQQ
jgi:cystine transport system substrate-binding protein